MKIIQSFWTKPFLNRNGNLPGHRFNGGWPHRVLNCYSWALSCLQLRSFYDSVELVTDTAGKEILIEALQLPYTRVHVELDSLDAVHHGLWAMGKLYAYGMQTTPFIHVDNDVFIWAPFNEQLCQGGLIAQNVQYETSSYTNTFREVLRTFPRIPEFLRQYGQMKFVPCVNAGILGGNDTRFIRQYVQQALAIINDNRSQIDEQLSNTCFDDLNVIIEQVLLYGLAKVQNKEISCLFPWHRDIPAGIGFFQEASNNRQYVHCFGNYKKSRVVYASLENRLKTSFPDYYKRINDLVATLEL